MYWLPSNSAIFMYKKSQKSNTVSTDMTRTLKEDRRREIGDWAEQTAASAEPVFDRPPSPVEHGRFTQAEEKWKTLLKKDSNGRRIKPGDASADVGYPLGTYEYQGFQFVETTRGYTVRPTKAHYLDRALYLYPFEMLSRATLLKIKWYIEKALKHTKRSMDYAQEFGRTVIIEGPGKDPDKERPNRRLFYHWNMVCDVLDRMEQTDGWDSFFEFCNQKANLIINNHLLVTAEYALSAYVNLDHPEGHPLSLYLDHTRGHLIRHMGSDLQFVERIVDSMLRLLQEMDEPEEQESAMEESSDFGISGQLRGPGPPDIRRHSSPQIPSLQIKSPLQRLRSMRALSLHVQFVRSPSPEKSTSPRKSTSHQQSTSSPKTTTPPVRVRSVRGRLTGSYWVRGGGTCLPRPEDEADHPRYESIFHEDFGEAFQEMDIAIAQGKRGVKAGTKIRGAYPNRLRRVINTIGSSGSPTRPFGDDQDGAPATAEGHDGGDDEGFMNRRIRALKERVDKMRNGKNGSPKELIEAVRTRIKIVNEDEYTQWLSTTFDRAP
ncbi:hypothetical protein NA57DRAFT_79756 [Rhizodiscina lignyota]|uniref:Uncharacterized protein n=1 Tax=Rhizodiscina lignyota TaxID=1504668 RepID=A0A9P4I875_9PEZI|nr:hypothetical protein NA57DRAFT_79756 [Rhizodiscina lignyota]